MNTEDLIKQLDDKKLLDLLYGYAYKHCDNSHDADNEMDFYRLAFEFLESPCPRKELL